MLVGQKWRVPRSTVIEYVQRICDVDLFAIKDELEITKAIAVVENMRERGIPTTENPS